MAKLDLNQATREQLVDAAGLRPFVAEAVLKARDERGGELADIGALKDALEGVRGVGPATLDQLGEVLKVGRGRPARPAAGKADDAPAPAAKAGAGKTAEVAASDVKVARRTAEEPAEVPAQGVTVARQTTDRTKEPAEVAASGVKVARQVPEEPAEVPTPAVKAGAEEVRRTVERTAEVVPMAARGAAETVGRATEKAAEVASATARDGAEAGKAAAARSGEAAGGLGRVFAELARDQARANVEALRALARARTWGEALEVQAGFLRGNVERTAEGAARYVGAVTRLAAGLARVGRDKGRTAA